MTKINPAETEPNLCLNELSFSNEILINEMIAQRVAWSYFGNCARHTPIPNGKKTESGDSEVGAGGFPTEELLAYDGARKKGEAMPSTFGYVIQTNNYPSVEFYNQMGLLVSVVDSQKEGYSEIVYVGLATSMDQRSRYAPYKICQKIPTQLAQLFYQRILQNPELIEQFFQASCPKFQSDKNIYNGLYRVMTDKVFVLNEEQIKVFIQSQSTLKESKLLQTLDDHQLIELRESGTKITLKQPVGSGTVKDFLPIKLAWQAKADQMQADREARRVSR